MRRARKIDFHRDIRGGGDRVGGERRAGCLFSIFFRFKHLFVFPESLYYSEFLIRIPSIDVSVSVYGIDIPESSNIPIFLYELRLVLKARRKSETGWTNQIFISIPSSIFGWKEIFKSIPFH